MAVGSVKQLSLPAPSRPHDYAYDPLFLVSGPKDHYKAAMLARLSTAKFQICPIFANMFSDLPNHPCKLYIRRRSPRVPPSIKRYKSRIESNLDSMCAKPPDIHGTDRCKFFNIPKTNVGAGFVPKLELYEVEDTQVDTISLNPDVKNKHRKVQTVYRESSVQTSPWEPSFIVTGDTDPELLKLDFLKWGCGLPAGQHEVYLLERARMKRAWEERCEVNNAEDLEKRRTIIAAMERDEWAFREQEIEEIQKLRMQLLQNMLNELHEQNNERNRTKLKNFAQMKYNEMSENLQKLRNKTNRELRKLELKHNGINVKYHYVNVVDEHINPASEVYAPMIRHGEHPKRWHLIIDDALKRFRAQFAGIEDFNTLPTWLDKATRLRFSEKLKGTRLCIRETKWTAPVLKELHEELLALRKHTVTPCTLIRKIESPPSTVSTPEVEGISDSDEDFYQSMVLMQAIIKGRAAQMHIYEGRERCRELIQELKHSCGLLEEETVEINDYKQKIKYQHRKQQIEAEKLHRLQESLDRLQSTVVGSLLDFLNKELQRLVEERKAHAICYMLERERYDREAAEAGRRQVEVRRRREHDEMFKQIVKIQQETVDLYLEDIIKEGMQFTSDQEAKEYVRQMAKKIDEEAMKLKEAINVSLNDETEAVADLVHHFVLPEVEKQMIRKRIHRREVEKLRTVHDSIYNELEDIGEKYLHKETVSIPKEEPVLPTQSSESADITLASEKTVDTSPKFKFPLDKLPSV